MGLDRTQQVHIVPMGYETERIYKPPIENNADKVILLLHEEKTKNGDKCQTRVEEALSEAGIPCEYNECDIFDMYGALWAIAEAVDEYVDDEVFVNLSTGSKITAIGGMIACMGTGAKPYYVKAEEYSGETVSKGVEDTVTLSAYPIGLPDQQYLKVMEYIQQAENSVAKGDVVEFVQNSEFPLLSRYNRKDLKNMYMPVDHEILRPLRDRGYIKEQRRGQEKRVWLTEDGEKTLEIFQYLLA